MQPKRKSTMPSLRPTVELGPASCAQCGAPATEGSGVYEKVVWERMGGEFWDDSVKRFVRHSLPTVKKAHYDYTHCPACLWTKVVSHNPNFLSWEGSVERLR